MWFRSSILIKKSQEKLFTQPTNRDLSDSWVGVLGENQQGVGSSHPFPYAFLAPNQAILQDSLFEILHKTDGKNASADKTTPKRSIYLYGRTEAAIKPDEIQKQYYAHLQFCLKLLTDVDWSNKDNDALRVVYNYLPSYDEMYRQATKKKITDNLIGVYRERYEARKITSLTQSFIFLDEYVWLIIVGILKDKNFERLTGNMSACMNGQEMEFRQKIENWSRNFLFKTHVEFINRSEHHDWRIPAHLVVQTHINQSIKMYFIRRMIVLNIFGSVGFDAKSTMENALNGLISMVDSDDNYGVRAGIQDEVKMSHKSFYAPHELLFLR